MSLSLNVAKDIYGLDDNSDSDAEVSSKAQVSANSSNKSSLFFVDSVGSKAKPSSSSSSARPTVSITTNKQKNSRFSSSDDDENEVEVVGTGRRHLTRSSTRSSSSSKPAASQPSSKKDVIVIDDDYESESSEEEEEDEDEYDPLGDIDFDIDGVDMDDDEEDSDDDEGDYEEESEEEKEEDLSEVVARGKDDDDEEYFSKLVSDSGLEERDREDNIVEKKEQLQQQKKSKKQIQESEPDLLVFEDKTGDLSKHASTTAIAAEAEAASTPATAGPTPKMRRKMARYWDPLDISLKCYNCGGVGHMSRDCTAPAVLKPCFLCGQRGHQSNKCPNEMCFRCLRTGHQAKACDQQRLKQLLCLRCGSRSHLSTQCRFSVNGNGSDRYDEAENLDDVRCFVCGETGHLNCARSIVKPGRIPYCSNCAEKGHTYMDCKAPRLDAQLDSYATMATPGRPSNMACFICGSMAHFARACPRASTRKQRGSQSFKGSHGQSFKDKGGAFGRSHKGSRTDKPIRRQSESFRLGQGISKHVRLDEEDGIKRKISFSKKGHSHKGGNGRSNSQWSGEDRYQPDFSSSSSSSSKHSKGKTHKGSKRKDREEESSSSKKSKKQRSTLKESNKSKSSKNKDKNRKH